MKRSFSRPGHREKTDKIERKANAQGTIQKLKSSKRKPSIYDDFDEEEDDFTSYNPKHFKPKR